MRVLLFLTGLAVVAGTVPLAAQELATCSGGTVVGDFGWTGLSCNCTHYVDEDDQQNSRWDFRSEPTIIGVSSGSPADGRLRAGDVIVAIDGQLITTREGGRRFAQIEPGTPATLRIRRDGQELTLTLTPSAECRRHRPPAPVVAVGVPRAVRGVAAVPAPAPVPAPDTVSVAPAPPPPPAAAAVPRPGAMVVVGRPPAPPGPPPVAALPSGWLGLSVSCSDCFISTSNDGSAEWHFSSPPLIEAVESGSPAFRAGIRPGDRLTRIDGVEITTDEGGSRFGAVRPGQRMEVQYERNGRSLGTTVVAGERTVAEAPPSPPGVPVPARGSRVAAAPRPAIAEAPQPDVVRFSGLLGDTFIEVTGGPVTVSQTETEIIIRGAEITVRVRRAAAGGGGR